MTIPTYVMEYIGKNDPELKEINLSNLGLDDNDVEELFCLLSKNPFIQSIDLSHNNISQPKFLAQLENLKIINLSENNLGDIGVKCFSNAYTSFNLTKLNLRNNGLTDHSVNTLNKLNWNGVEIDIDDKPELGKKVKELQNLTIKTLENFLRNYCLFFQSADSASTSFSH